MYNTSLETAYLMVWLNQVVSEPSEDPAFFSVDTNVLGIYAILVNDYAELGRFSVDYLLFNQLAGFAFRSELSNKIARRDADREFIKLILNQFSRRVDWDAVGRLVSQRTGCHPGKLFPPSSDQQ